MSDSAGGDKQTIKCTECGNRGVEGDDGVCVFCTQPDAAAVDRLQTVMDKLVDNHGLAAAFWSLDKVYDEFDEVFGEESNFEVPIYEATVIVPDHESTSGERYDTRRVDGCLNEGDARERVLSDPDVRRIENIEQVDTAVVA